MTWCHAIKKIASRVWEGISAIQHLKKRRLFILYTLLMWTLYLVAVILDFMPLQETEHYGIREAFTVLSAGSIGMIDHTGWYWWICISYRTDNAGIWFATGYCIGIWLAIVAGQYCCNTYWRFD